MRKPIIAILVLAACVIGAQGQEVTIQDNAPFTYAYLEGNGPYNQIGAKIGALMQEISKQQLQGDGAPFGLYLNSPQEVKSEAELKWRVGIPVSKKVPVAAPLLKDEFNFTKVARYLYTGPYEKVPESYAKIFQYIGANGYQMAGPIMEQYWNDPMTVKPEQLMTEIIIPVVKK